MEKRIGPTRLLKNAAIAPWNYPLMMGAWKLAAPLAAGCTVTLKPSELTPLSTLRFTESVNDILPKGVINVIFGRGANIGDQLIPSIWFEGISITGSPATGMEAMRAATLITMLKSSVARSLAQLCRSTRSMCIRRSGM